MIRSMGRPERSESSGKFNGFRLSNATKPTDASAHRLSTPRADGSTRSHANHTSASVAPIAFATALTPRINEE
jgi:hypothetical protein